MGGRERGRRYIEGGRGRGEGGEERGGGGGGGGK